MAIKINLKDLPQVASIVGTDLVPVAYGPSGLARLVPASQLGGGSLGATGIKITSEDDGYTYEITVIIVDGQPVTTLTKVSGEGQFISVLGNDGHTYQLTVVIVDGKPNLQLVLLS